MGACGGWRPSPPRLLALLLAALAAGGGPPAAEGGKVGSTSTYVGPEVPGFPSMHAIITAECGPYFTWQSLGFFYAWRKVPGTD